MSDEKVNIEEKQRVHEDDNDMTSARTRGKPSPVKRARDEGDKKEDEEDNGMKIGASIKFQRPDGREDGYHRFSVKGPVTSGEDFAHKISLITAVGQMANKLTDFTAKLHTVKPRETDGTDPTRKLRQIMQIEEILRGLDKPKYSNVPIVKESLEILFAGSGDLPDRIKSILKGATRAQTARSRRVIEDVKRDYAEHVSAYANDRPEFFCVIYDHLVRGWKHIIDQVEREFDADEANRVMQECP